MSNQTSITVIICYKIKKIKVLSKIKIIKLCRYFKQILIKNTLLSNIVFVLLLISDERTRFAVTLKLREQLQCYARAFLVFYCTNYLHELTAEALGYKVTLI